MAAALLMVGGGFLLLQVSPQVSFCCFLLALSSTDYELQVSLAEALCRLTPRKEREQRANRWFSSCDISRAFCDITDRDFEVVTERLMSQ